MLKLIKKEKIILSGANHSFERNIYILNIEFIGSQDVKFSLRKFYGLSTKSINLIFKYSGISAISRVNFKDLSSDKIIEIKNYIYDNFIIEADLIREITKNLDSIKQVNCIKKLRFKLNLPVNGQRQVRMQGLAAEKKVCSIIG